MATELGKAYVQIIPSAKGISGAIQSELSGGGIAQAASSTGLNIAGMIKKAIVAGGIGAAIKSSISEGMELEQNLGGTEAVFGKFASSIQEKATQAYKNMGLSASDYMATANKMGSLFQGSGVEQEKALNMTADAMQRAADVASVMGIDMNMAMESIAGAAKGNFTMMDNLGVAMNATTLQAYALEKGLDFEWKTADNAQKAEVAMQMFMERTSQYANNFARESEDTLSGSVGAMRAAWQNLLGYLSTGGDVSGAMSELVKSAVTFLQGNLIPSIVNIAKGIPTALSGLGGGLIQALRLAANNVRQNGGKIISDAFNGIGGGIIDIAAWIPYIVEDVLDLVGAFGKAILEADWSELTSNLGSKLFNDMSLALGETFGVNTDDFGIVGGIVNGITTALPQFLETATILLQGFTQGILQSLPGLLNQGVVIVNGVVQGILMNLPGLISAGVQFVNTLISGIGQALPMIMNAGNQMEISLKTGLISAIPDLIAGAGQIMVSLLDAFLTYIPQGLEMGFQLVGALAQGLLNNAPAILANIATVLANLLAKIASHLPQLLQSGIELIGKMAAGLIRAIPDVVAKIPQIIQSIVNAFGRYDWGSIGLNIIKGIANGIKNAASFLLDAAKEAAGKALEGAKKFLGIESPSKVFEKEVGHWIPPGIARGILGNMGVLDDAIDRMSTDALEATHFTGNYDFAPRDPKNAALEQQLDALLMLLARYLPMCAEKVTIDGDSLMTSINQQLGLATM